MNNPIRLSKRQNGGVHIIQGKSFVLLDRDEALKLIADMQNLISADSPPRAETMNKIDTRS
ncbi:hypothetical protein MPUL_34510 [Mycolicibacterium pulveris]|uniref:Uncharacterized protein n=1 Tax=Mycolicibacterium pulveris TaxID=36813 RepID=A0A7I7UN75_MYCPV|nr:hypothetical protein MPUL_34510 [Mycolicibacterium pulveris]